MVRYLFPSVGTDAKLERCCPHCHRFGAWIHSGVRERTISDIRTEKMIQKRQHCPFCGTSWTVRAAVEAEELRTDELSVYNHTVAEEDHTICLAHWLKSKCKRASDLARRFRAEKIRYETETLLEVKALLHRHWRSPRFPEEIERLVRRFINCRDELFWKTNQLLQHIERSWSSVSRDRLDPTNNATERIIGLTYKIRAKTMRGFKSRDKALAHLYLAQFLRGAEGLCDLRRVI